MPTPAYNADRRVTEVRCSGAALVFFLADGRMISVPTAWYRQLREATPDQRESWEHASNGDRVVWPLLKIEVDAEDLLNGTAAPHCSRDFHCKKLPYNGKADKLSQPDTSDVAYITSDNANALYEPSYDIPPRMTPQYGDLVDIIDSRGDFVLIRWIGKEGWVERGVVSKDEPPKRPENKVPESIAVTAVSKPYVPPLEIGPRGGVFARTKSGFRRYL